MHMLNLAVKSDCDKLQHWPNYEFIVLLYNITTTALIVQILYRDLCVVWWFTDSQGGVGVGGIQDEIIYPFDDKNKKVASSNLVKS